MFSARSDVRKVACPKCKATPKALCRNVEGGTRVSNHIERLQAYERLTGVEQKWEPPVRSNGPQREILRQNAINAGPCIECGAGTGSNCTRVNGRSRTMVHAARLKRLQRA